MKLISTLCGARRSFALAPLTDVELTCALAVPHGPSHYVSETRDGVTMVFMWAAS